MNHDEPDKAVQQSALGPPHWISCEMCQSYCYTGWPAYLAWYRVHRGHRVWHSNRRPSDLYYNSCISPIEEMILEAQKVLAQTG